MKKTKILVYDANFAKHITRDILIMKIKYWQENNCDITILCTKAGKKYYNSVLQNISFISLNYSYTFKSIYLRPIEFAHVTLLALFNIKSIINRFDIIYSQSSIIDFLLLPWVITFFDSKVKWCVLVENIVPPPHKRPGPFLRNLIPYVAFLIGEQFLRRTSDIFVISQQLYKYYKIRKYNVIRIGEQYGIDLDIFKGSVSKSSPQFDAVYCGRLHEAKGVFDLIEVVKEVVKIKKNFVLGIMGDGSDDLKRRLSDRIATYRLKENIVFNGYVTGKRKGDILRRVGFFLFLSYDEAGGHAILEALACNKIVIAYNLPVYHEVFYKYIKSGQLILFKQKDFKSIANFILQLKFKNVYFYNKLEDYKWDGIVQNELESMRKSQNVFNRKDKI